MSAPLKIKVGIPSYSGKLFPETWETVKALSAYEGPVSFDVLIVPQCYCTAEARNKAAAYNSYCKQYVPDYDYFLSMDADMSFPVSAVLMLIDDKKDIVSAGYNMRSAKLSSLVPKLVAAHWTEKPGIAPGTAYLPDSTKGIQKVDTVGLGCCLINAAVFKKMEYPFFRHNIVEFNNGKSALLVQDDISFCMDAARYGFEIFVDADIRVNHHSENEDR